MNKKVALVTGCAGFIGSHLVDRLLEKGYKVIGVDNLFTGSLDNLKNAFNNNNFNFYETDINYYSEINTIISCYKPNIIFHLAANPFLQYSIDNPIETQNTNTVGTLSLLKASSTYNVKRFVFASSSSVYGNCKKSHIKETKHTNPMSPYAMQKLHSEEYCSLYSRLYGIETICLRMFNVFGPRQRPDTDYSALIPKTIEKTINNKSPEIYGDGKQTRDFVYVKDIVDAWILAGEKKSVLGGGEIYNVGTSTNTTVNNIVKTILKITDNKIEPIHKSPVKEPKHSKADTTLIKEKLKWFPKYTLKEGLKETINYFMEKNGKENK